MKVSFSNSVIDLDDLPRLSESEFTPIERAYLWSRLLLVGGWGAGLLGLVGIAAASDLGLSAPQVGLAGAGVIVVLAGVAVLQWLEVGQMGYLVREHDFSFRSGVIRKSVVTIPFSRVQNVAVDRGPLVRAFGVANLRLFSAGGGITTMGLTIDDAQHLKSFVVDKARVAADEEQAARR